MRTTRKRKRTTHVEPIPPIPPEPSPEPGPPTPLPDPAPEPEPEPDRASVLLRLAELPRATRDRALAESRRGAAIRGGIVRLPRAHVRTTSR